MCGFFISNCHTVNLTKKVLDDSLGFRGPDFQSEIVKFRGWSVYHARLSIIATNDHANQPIITESGLLVFNGEIFNYRELAIKYSICDLQSDTLVLSRLLELENFDLSELEGFFAFVKIDQNGQMTHCVRDNFGVKPLFYYKDGESISVASEANILVDLFRLSVEENAIEEYKLFRSPLISGTYYKNLRQVQPGACLINGIYFDLKDFFLNAISLERMSDNDLETTLQSSIKSRQISDVSFSLLFSGGIDSNVIRELLSSDPEYLFCGMFESESYDHDTTQELKKLYDLNNLHTVSVCKDEFIPIITRLVKLRKEPLSVPNEVILFKIAQEARRLGQKVLLSGEGADEFFAGYDRIYSHFAVNKFSTSEFLKMYCYDSFSVTSRVCEYFTTYFDGLHELSAFNKVRFFFVDQHLPVLFRRLDFSLMAAGIEGREPLATKSILSAALSYGKCDLLGHSLGKLPLRRILSKRMGSEFAFRKKVGFPVNLQGVSKTSNAKENYKIWNELNLEAMGWL